MTAQLPPQAFFHDLADAAGAAILPLFRTRITVEDKDGRAGFDPVTEADRAAEAAMRRLIEASYPEHGIFGEEYGEKPAQGPFTWVLDPIDGTRAFIAGLPTWGTIIGLTRDGAPVAGLFDQPFTGERLWAVDGPTQYRDRNGARQVTSRRRDALADATLMTTTPALFDRGAERAAYDRIEALSRNVRYGGDAYAYGLIAQGHVDLVVEAGLQPYDVVGLIPIVTGAGGVMTTWTGASAAGGGRIVAAGSAALHAQALALLADTPAG